MLACLIPSTIFIGIFVLGGLAVMLVKFPCMPPFLGSMLDTCRAGIELGISVRIILLVVEFVILLPTVVAANYNVYALLRCQPFFACGITYASLGNGEIFQILKCTGT